MTDTLHAFVNDSFADAVNSSFIDHYVVIMHCIYFPFLSCCNLPLSAGS